MDRERMDVAAGPGGRIPMPELPEEKPKQAPRRNLRDLAIAAVCGVLALALGIGFLVFALQAGKTPQQAVAAAAGEEFVMQEEIVRVSLPGAGERSVMFFISNDQLACALLERRASGYRVESVSGHLPLTSLDKPGIWMASNTQGGQSSYLVFGLLYSASLSQVEVNGQQAVIVDTGMYRCWYYYGEGSTTINSESVVYR